MAEQRNPKRQRKKDAAAARRQALLEQMARRRRQRMVFLVSMAAVLLVSGGAIAAIVTRGDRPASQPEGKATPSPAASPAPIACGGKPPPPPKGEKSFDAPADQKLNPKKTYIWKLDTSCGTIEVKLDVAKSPKTTNSIVFLTREGFYDGLKFHRVVRDFVVQGGDPQGTGAGGPGYDVVEAPAQTQKYPKGTVAMAKAGTDDPGTSGSQFFIMSGDKGLPPDYAVVGTVIGGMSVVDAINKLAPPGQDGAPSDAVYIDKATIVEQ